MKSKPIVLFAGCCAAGLLLGYSAKRLNHRETAPAADAGAAVKAARTDKNSAVADAPLTAAEIAAAIPSASKTRSTETLESLKADDTDLYSRLALWMVDASQEDIAAYWQHYRGQPQRSNDITDIVFINWARIDPTAATAAVKGTPEEHYAWWAWGCHDPQAALAAALASNPDRAPNVTWAIGEFHHDWLRLHFDELPEDSRGNALQGFAKWDDHADPEASLDFLKEKGHGFHSRLFQVLTLRDPWAAYDWLEQNGSAAAANYGDPSAAMDSFATSLAHYHPDVLARIAETMPSGDLKRKMEAKVFQGLLKDDLEAAIQQATETKGPVIARDRLAAVGSLLTREHPDRAFEMAERLLTVCPDPWNTGVKVVTPNGGSTSWSSEGSQIGEFMAKLSAADPLRTIQLAETSQSPSAFSNLAAAWARRDVGAYADWVETQPPEKRDKAAAVLVSQLRRDNNYAEAAEWAKSMTEGSQNQLVNVVANWASRSPGEAKAWVESAELPEETRKTLEGFVSRNQQ
ncbi:hypothetical protein [Luteolibacter sp. Populi]|uniref:hypothetical protein n=1 Tax=Luteolibacter sp. Populi TaxID=3230487 RepID=UPI003467D96F